MFDQRPSLTEDPVSSHDTPFSPPQKDSEKISLEQAQEILGLRSIDKAYQALMRSAASSQFRFSPRKAAQAIRPYQHEAMLKLKELLDKDFKTMALQLPTGAGKTFVIHAFLHDHFIKKGRNVLVIVPSWEIANQHAMTVCQHFPEGAERVRRLGGRGQLISSFAEFEDGGRGQVIITTSALFYARQATLRDSVKAAAVVIDEGHHGWKKKRLNSVQSFARELDIPAILLTATPPQNMDSLPFAAQLRYLDLVPEFLVPCQVVRLETGEEFDPVFRNGALVQSSMNELSSRHKRFEKIVADSIPAMRGQTIYYAGSVNEAMGVLEEFKKHGVSATVVHSKWASKGDKINALAIDKFRKGEVRVLVNVQMLAMGFDVPNVETIIVARPVESDTLFTQMVGRGARPSENKSEFILIDVHDTIFKPEVAKVFEHKHLFYSGPATPEAPEIVGPQAAAEPLPLSEIALDEVSGFPWRDEQQRGINLNFKSYHFFRDQELIQCFARRKKKRQAFAPATD